MRTASSSSSARKIEETGPKNSVLAVGEPTGMSVMIVGWKKAPRSGTGDPTCSTVTPASRAARTFAVSSSTADCEDSGARVVEGSMGSPATSRATPARYLSTNSS